MKSVYVNVLVTVFFFFFLGGGGGCWELKSVPQFCKMYWKY